MKFDEAPLTSAAPEQHRSLMPEIVVPGPAASDSPRRFEEEVVLAALRLLERKSAKPTFTRVETAVVRAAAELFRQLAEEAEDLVSPKSGGPPPPKKSSARKARGKTE